LLTLPATTAEEQFVDPTVPADLYGLTNPGPSVSIYNVTIEQGGSDTGKYRTEFLGYVGDEHEFGSEINVTLEIYSGGSFGGPQIGRKPQFSYLDVENNNTIVFSSSYSFSIADPAGSESPEVNYALVAFDDTSVGYYRIRVLMTWNGGDAKSMGFFGGNTWEKAIDDVKNEETPSIADYLINEAGFTVVPEDYLLISKPNRVPDLGDFTTPVIRPGETGTYNFTVTNRYDHPINDTTLEVEFYMWATIEESKVLGKIDGPPPKISSSKTSSVMKILGMIEAHASEPVKIDITTDEDTPKGTYFVRHRITFTYNETEFTMSSRGYFSKEQWEGFDYSNLYYQLDGNAGIIPDSSFSVKDPVPLWPLATLISLCVLFAALAVVFYLAEEHGEKYPRLKRSLQFWSGRWEQRKRLWEQRLDEMRGDTDIPLDDEDT
jgi:hypothetical protein